MPARDARALIEVNDALLELARDDPLDAWGGVPLLELDGPLDRRLDVVLAARANSRFRASAKGQVTRKVAQ